MSSTNAPNTQTDRASSARSTSPQRTSEQRQRLSPTAVGSVYPALESLQRISHGHNSPHTNGAGDAAVTSTSSPRASSSAGHYQRHNAPSRHPPTAHSVHHSQGPAIISQHALPTYRQASVSSGDGGTHGGHPSTSSETPAYSLESALPDILHSHMLPQVPPSRPNQHRQHRNRDGRPGESGGPSRGHRNRHRAHGDRSSRHRHRPRTLSTSSTQTQEGTCKEPCVKCVVTITSFRWVLVVLSVLGVFCVVTGIVLAALHAAGNSFLFLAIMFIGLGVLLVVVVGVGWKCTPRGHEPLHALFGIGNFRHGQTRERRHRRHRNRDGNWFGGVLYPEFQFRRPPPSYAASMQDYQNQALQDQENSSAAANIVQSDSLPSSPPPSYRSRASTVHSGIHIAFPQTQDGDHPSSRPPTYRSRAPSRRPSLPRNEVQSANTESAPADVAFTGPSLIQSSQATRVAVISSSTAPPISSSSAHSISSTATLQTTAGNSNKEGKTDSSPTTASSTLQVHTMPVVRSSTDAQNSSAVLSNTQSSASNSAVGHSLSSSSSPQHQPAGSSGARLPSLHQRMESEDRHILEQALQSLEEHMNETEGVTNHGATFDEQDQSTDHLNTHL